MWQKCPICNGIESIHNNMNTSSTCKTCNGKGIINKLTGEPPKENQQQYFGHHKKRESSGDFRDDNIESQDEYFGRK